MRRYRCRADGCGWEGLLPRRRHRDRPSRRAARAAAVSQVARLRLARYATVILLGLSAAVAGTVAWVRQLPAPFVGAGRVVPAGQSYDGDALPPEHPLLTWAAQKPPPASTTPAPGPSPSASPGTSSARPPASSKATPAANLDGGWALALRQNCAWGEPGRMPYAGSVDQALGALRLPPKVAEHFAQRIRAHQVSDRVEIRNDAIQAEKMLRVYDPRRIAMTFGRTLCIGTQVHFAPRHAEWGDLYEVADGSGRRWAVMVPDACGNVSLLHARGAKGDGEGDAYALATGGWADFDEESSGLQVSVHTADDRPLDGTRGILGTLGKVFNIPEPGTLESVGVALGALALTGWLRRRRVRATPPSASPPRRP